MYILRSADRKHRVRLDFVVCATLAKAWDKVREPA